MMMLVVMVLIVVMLHLRIVVFLVKGRIVALTVDANQAATEVGLGDIIIGGALTVDADFSVPLLLCSFWHQPGWWAGKGFDLVVFDLVLSVYLSKAIEEWSIE